MNHFVAFAAYTAAPIITVPVIGLSWSAPLFYAIALQLFVGLRGAGVPRQRLWNRLAIALWLGIAASFFWNALSGEMAGVDLWSVSRVVQFAYWMLVFVTSTHIVRRAQVGPRLPLYLGAAIVALAIVVLFERLVLGISGSTGRASLTRLPQNAYGWQFSTFSAFLLVPATAKQGRRRWLALLGLVTVWSAAAVNGSRSSWGAMGAALLVFVVLHLLATRSPRSLGLLAAVVTAGLLLASVAPASVKERVEARASTLERLETDKSHQIRLLMIQKAWRLFGEHPVLGVGPGRFRASSTELNIQQVLTYADQSHFDRMSAHNAYMLLLAEGGLACVIPFAALLLLLLVRGARAAVVLGHQGQPWALAAYAGFIGMSVHLWSIAGLTSSAPWVVYAIVAGAVESERQLRATRQQGRPGD